LKQIESLLTDYASYHQTRGNKICHFIGIPLIIFSLFALLREISIFSFVTAAELLIVLSMIYYLMLDVRLALGMLLVSVLIDLLAWKIGDLRIGVVALITGWIFQAIGHAVFEKRSPAFTKNLVHLLIGPLFLLAEILPGRGAIYGANSDRAR
jgi:uncharacterized membrane protein YGL010W